MLVSIIIPCKNESDDISALLDGIEKQKDSFEKEVIRIVDVSPSGKARNKGAEQAKGDVLIFLDNDIRFGDTNVIKNIVDPLLSDENIGVCGASQLIPPDSNAFQKRLAKEVPHTQHAVSESTKDVGMVGGACCAIPKDVFLEAGKFHDTLIRGIDGEFCFRLKARGYRVILAAKTWIHHPPPKNLWQFMKVTFHYGQATAFADKYYPQLNLDIGTDDIASHLEQKSKGFRIRRYIQQILKAIILLRPIYLVYKFVYPVGYSYGLIFLSKKNV